MKVVLLGSPLHSTLTTPDPDTRIVSYADTSEKISLLNRARFVICRSGYSALGGGKTYGRNPLHGIPREVLGAGDQQSPLPKY
jgi:hypothetical protein